MTDVKQYKNGLRVIVDEQKSNRGVSIKFYALVGGKDEDDTNRGIAHLAEHMFFKGTPKRDSRTINLEFDKRGIFSNAFTADDMTCFFADGMDEHAEIIFDVLSDCFFNSLYPAEELAKESQVVCSELEMYENEAQDKANSIGQILALQGTEYAYALGGTVESVSKITTQDLIKFRDKFYTPNRLLISVSGNISKDKVFGLVDKYVLSNCAMTPAEPISYKKELLDIKIKNREAFSAKDTDQVYGIINFKGINDCAPEVPALNIARLALASTFTSRLFLRLREENGLVYVIQSGLTRYGECGWNDLFFICNQKNVEKTLTIIRDEIKNIRANGFTQEELETFINISRTSLILNAQSNNAIATNNANAMIYREQKFDISERIKAFEDLTLEKVNAVFNKYFDFDYLTFAYVAKEKNDNYYKLLIQ